VDSVTDRFVGFNNPSIILAMGPAAIESQLREFLAANAEREGIAAAYLFGSVARGTVRPESDVDVGILYSEEPPRTLDGLGLDLEGDLEALLKLPVQAVVLNRASVDLVIRVLRDGKLLVDRDRSKRLRFEVRSRNEFWDLEPYLKMYRKTGATETDPEFVAKKLALIETSVRELQTFARPDEIQHDVRELRFVAYTLQIAIQAALDVAAHIVADERLGEPRTNRDLFDLLERYRWVPPELAISLRDMVGFRNIVVYDYERVNDAMVEEIVRDRLDDLLGFVSEVRAKP
jgi:uncharacterized protein YutE (UPF0331/DUF86 family)/predicted nucleotidyltransferase